MIEALKKMLGMTDAGTGAGAGAGRCQDVRRATCAVFLEMAMIDGEFTDAERARVLDAMQREHAVSAETAERLLETAEQERRHRIDLWQFTRLINEQYAHEDKLGLVKMLWRVVYTDGRLDQHEDYLVHKLSNLLNLTHKELIDAKVAVLHGCGKAPDPGLPGGGA